MKVIGAKEVERKLKELEPKLAKKVLKRGLRAGAKIVRKAAQSKAPIKTGGIKKGIKVRAGKTKKGFISIRVGVGNQWFTGPNFYAAFVEFGHKVGRRLSKAKDAALHDTRKGYVEGQHFIEEAYKASQQAAKAAAIAKILAGIEEVGRG